MTKKFLKDAVGWGVALWVIGYVLGFVFYAFVPPAQIGWYVMPIGVIVTLWVLLKKIHGTLGYYAAVGLVWAAIAVVLDYVLLVKMLHPADGYYKADVYVYYILTYLLPVAVGLFGRSGDTRAANEARRTDLGQAHEKVMALFGTQTEISNDDVQRALGVSDATATNYLNALEAAGKIRRIGADGRFVKYIRANG